MVITFPQCPAELSLRNMGGTSSWKRVIFPLILRISLCLQEVKTACENKKGHKVEWVYVSSGNVTKGTNVHQVHLNAGRGGMSEGMSVSLSTDFNRVSRTGQSIARGTSEWVKNGNGTLLSQHCMDQ